MWVMEVVSESGTGYAKEFSSIAGFLPLKNRLFFVVVEGFFPFIFFLSERWRRVVRDSPQGEGEESGAFN